MKHWILIQLVVLGVMTLPATAQAEDIDTFLCSLKVVRLMNQKVLIDIRDQKVQMNGNQKAKVFDGVIQTIHPGPAMFLVESSYTPDGGVSVPELNIGIYNPNKFDPKKPRLVSKASGDARAFAKLESQWVTGNTIVTFTCKNVNYR